MKRLSFALLPVALFCVAAKGGCGGDNPCQAAICAEPDIGPGCYVGEAMCIDGKPACAPVICPDAGVDAGSDAASQDAAQPDAAPSDAASWDGGAPDARSLDAGAVDVATDGAAGTDSATTDAGTFPCDSGDGSPITCDGRTQACKIVEGGAYPGVHAPSCVTLPPACQAAPTCTCVAAAAGVPTTGPCVDQGGNFTVTLQAP